MYNLVEEEGVEFNIGFNTKYEDLQNEVFLGGLIYYNNRYYDSNLGRFISQDPIFEEGGVNLYNFVENDPINHWDILGKASFASARDLTSSPFGNHHFETITGITQQDLDNMGINAKLQNFGNGIMGITVGIFPNENDILTVMYNQRDDLKATEEFYSDSTTLFESDWDYEQHQITPPNGVTLRQLDLRSLAAASALQKTLKNVPTSYNLVNCNCSSGLNSLLSIIGISEEDREELTEFSGIDWGEENLLNEGILNRVRGLYNINYQSSLNL